MNFLDNMIGKADENYIDPRIETFMYKKELKERIDNLGRESLIKLLDEWDRYEILHTKN